MKRKRAADADVEAVMAGNPILAWRAGCSLWMSLASAGLLIGSVSIAMLRGTVELGGQMAACLGLYGIFWLAGLMHEASEVAEGPVEPTEAYRRAFVLRAAMFVMGYSLALWSDDGDVWLAAAVMTAGFWIGAVVEGACVLRVARDHGFSIRKGVMVCMGVAPRGCWKAVGVKEEAERDG